MQKNQISVAERITRSPNKGKAALRILGGMVVMAGLPTLIIPIGVVAMIMVFIVGGFGGMFFGQAKPTTYIGLLVSSVLMPLVLSVPLMVFAQLLGWAAARVAFPTRPLHKMGRVFLYTWLAGHSAIVALKVEGSGHRWMDNDLWGVFFIGTLLLIMASILAMDAARSIDKAQTHFWTRTLPAAFLVAALALLVAGGLLIGVVDPYGMNGPRAPRLLALQLFWLPLSLITGLSMACGLRLVKHISS